MNLCVFDLGHSFPLKNSVFYHVEEMLAEAKFTLSEKPFTQLNK